MIRELDLAETGLGYAAMRQLRGDLAGEAEFVHAVNEVQRAEGYRLVGSFEEGEEQAIAVAGFRCGQNLAWGRHLYVDDLVTMAQARGRGHGRALLDWLAAEARRLGCGQMHLDSGVGLERADAHRLYLGSGMVISAHHFARRVS